MLPAVLAIDALVLLAMRLLVAAFLGILFVQSGLDKVLDRKGNLEWLTGHFAKSPLRGVVPLLLATITLIELAAGTLSALGVVELLGWRSAHLALLGALASGLALVSLFLGQRMAKDYAGAAGLVPYFLVVLVALGLFGAR
jgi:hypothetical protein